MGEYKWAHRAAPYEINLLQIDFHFDWIIVCLYDFLFFSIESLECVGIFSKIESPARTFY